ncbi:MAG: hypothetical protein ABSB95_08525 [Dissulfurispiraceae bacterium]|jgi:hypothetical protein
MENNTALSRMQKNLKERNYYDAVERAVEVFDAAEAVIRRRVMGIEKQMDFSVVVVSILFFFALKIVIPHLPASLHNHAMNWLYISFFVYLISFPFLKYWIPKWIPISYLFRKEYFIHRVMDLFHMPIDKPILVDTPVRFPLFLRWGKVRLQNAAIARMFAPLVWIFRANDPFREVQRYEKQTAQ